MLLDGFLCVKGSYGTGSGIREYYENYRIGGLFFVYMTWLNNGCAESTEELIGIVKKVIDAENVIPDFRG